MHTRNDSQVRLLFPAPHIERQLVGVFGILPFI